MNLSNIKKAKIKLDDYDPTTFISTGDSFKHFVNRINIKSFRHIDNLDLSFEHPVTVITGTNKVGKTSVLLLIACSHYGFQRYDSTKVEKELRRHTWRDVLPFTKHETSNRNYSYDLYWRIGNKIQEGTGKRIHSSQAWTGVGKASQDEKRINAQIRNRQVRLIDLERILPARNFSNSLLRKINISNRDRVDEDIEQAFSYILNLPEDIEIYWIGSHINKTAFQISNNGEPYTSFNASSGEESLISILTDIFEPPDDSLILIDEIEAGFHPYIQRKLANIIQYVSWRNKKQFILTTHSPTLIAAFSQKSRKFIDKNPDGTYRVINRISVNAAFSKMDSESYPLLQLYCEDEIAEFLIRSMLVEINKERNYFDRLINIIKSGAINDVENDYKRHKRNYGQMKLKVGYACVFDGDHKNHPKYSSYYNNPEEFSFFLFPYTAPEKFLVKAYLNISSNESLNSALTHSDHHALFQEMVNEGLASDNSSALRLCWDEFKKSSEYSLLFDGFREFIIGATTHFSEVNETR